ncbi:transposase [Calycomorphotria hydatis]|uniref:Transposase IS4-like domain-containing protein n=1 Tax=Calycomorphotria hydatis TaxID=2528027 RepID=A0A517T5U0_9PLAN|nr:transposase [Calycomorphotria hydatis]QDT62880.1 hypothetical protein V22_00780 [Calycomorphotria hydatis]QDT63239.1 hypothetical protein V22_04580 [Calycomorphotria hydatis]QDT63513.1 hypothetical protein V22_07350 [Calycomorphotria hydatis]QDT63664.1 hypothetical protein V22_08880 [Calycomorphotria hydatis]QDT63721.1 hypothetical protein V22_09460 [Calycomorphotria hydatis]
MRHQLYQAIVTVIRQLAKPCACVRKPRFSDARILEVYFFAVIHGLPLSHACQRHSWPIHLRRQPLPDDSTMSRRLRTHSIRQYLVELETSLRRLEQQDGFVSFVDSKVLPVGPNSHDRDARFGYASGVKAKGYRLHALRGADETLIDWRLTPMNTDERVMARRMLTSAKLHGYVVGDGNFDDSKLHAVCEARSRGQGEVQLIAPKRRGKGFGHRKQRVGRLRSFDLLNSPEQAFAQALLQARAGIERFFGHLTSRYWSLIILPPWVRTFRRVHRYTQAQIALYHLHQQMTYVD